MLCYLYPEPFLFLFTPDLPELLYYSHIPAAIIALLVGLFVYLNGRKFLLNQLLLLISLSFALWVFVNLISWTNIHSELMLFAWSSFGPLFALISIFSIYFIYAFVTGKDAPRWVKIVFTLLIAPVFILAPTAASLTGLNITECDAFGYENVLFELYYHALGGLAMLWILALLIHGYRLAKPEFKKQIVFMGIGIEFFLFMFFSIGYISSYLTTIGIQKDSNLEMYGLFGMIVFMVYMAILLVRFKTFHVNMIAPQALVVALVILIGAQFTFIKSGVNFALNSIALVLTVIVGMVLVKSVRKEIEQREHIEKLAKDLAKANDQQVTLIHFITHQIKGFVTKSRNIFSMLKDGDYGQVPDSMKPLIDQGFDSDTKGVSTIQEILNAANIKSGKVSFIMSPFDLQGLIQTVAKDLRPTAETKGLELTIELDPEPLTITGDSAQLINAYKNLIDNSIKYTPKGSINLKLEKVGNKARFMVTDTGVGITSEDMAHLFTEGGHGKESQKVNVESTGFGLYIVKNIVEAHKGRVWAESDGQGKGSRFIIELPT